MRAPPGDCQWFLIKAEWGKEQDTVIRTEHSILIPFTYRLPLAGSCYHQVGLGEWEPVLHTSPLPAPVATLSPWPHASSESLMAEAGWCPLVRSLCLAGCLAPLGFGVDLYDGELPASAHSPLTYFQYAVPPPPIVSFSPQVLCPRTLECGYIWRQYLCRHNCPISRDPFRKGLKLNVWCSGKRRGPRSTLRSDMMIEKEMSPQDRSPKRCWRFLRCICLRLQ